MAEVLAVYQLLLARLMLGVVVTCLSLQAPPPPPRVGVVM
jgi:hypothetical protein